MKARINLQWKLNGETNQRSVSRKNFLQYLEEIEKIQPKEITHVIKGLAKRADVIYIDMDDNTAKKQKKIIFKYEENREYDENSEKVDLMNEEEIYLLFEKYFCN